MRLSHAAILAVLLGGIAAAPLLADPPAVTPVAVEVGKDRAVTVRPHAGAKFTAAPGFGPDECLWFPGERADDGSQVFLVRPYKPGTFRVVLWSEGDKRGAYSTLVLDATGGKDDPPPPVPDPKPKPDPAPAPAGPLWLIVVEETGERTPETAAVLGDAAYWLALRAKGHKFRFYDRDSADAKRLGYVKAAGDALPALVVLDATGAVVKAVKLPATTAGVDAMIGGAK